jgi:hypothetical protein
LLLDLCDASRADRSLVESQAISPVDTKSFIPGMAGCNEREGGQETETDRQTEGQRQRQRERERETERERGKQLQQREKCQIFESYSHNVISKKNIWKEYFSYLKKQPPNKPPEVIELEIMHPLEMRAT